MPGLAGYAKVWECGCVGRRLPSAALFFRSGNNAPRIRDLNSGRNILFLNVTVRKNLPLSSFVHVSDACDFLSVQLACFARGGRTGCPGSTESVRIQPLAGVLDKT